MILKSLIETLFKQQISGSYQQQDPLNHEQLVALRISRLVVHFRRKTASERPCWSAVSVRWRALHVACVARDANPWDPRILSWHDAPATDAMQNHRSRDSDHRLTMPHRQDKPEKSQKPCHNAVSFKTTKLDRISREGTHNFACGVSMFSQHVLLQRRLRVTLFRTEGTCVRLWLVGRCHFAAVKQVC